MQKSCQKQHFDRCLLWSLPPHYLQPSMFRTRLDNALTVGKNMSFLFKLQKVTKANFKKNPMQARPLDVYKQLPSRFRMCRSGRSFAQPLHHRQRSNHCFFFLDKSPGFLALTCGSSLHLRSLSIRCGSRSSAGLAFPWKLIHCNLGKEKAKFSSWAKFWSSSHC